MILDDLIKKQIAHPPKWLAPNTQYLTIMGSEAYGCSSGDSDKDIYGFCVPKKDLIFPHLAGEVLGFGKQINRFEQYQEHHILDKETGKEYDFQIFSIVKYFQLLMDNNPNVIDSLFTPEFCVLHITPLGQMVRNQRKIFLHKGCYHKFRGYAHAQSKKLINKKLPKGKRKEDVEKHGYSTKFAYHIIRLALEAEQLLQFGDLDLKRDREILKSVRRGEWTEEEILKWFSDKEKYLESLYEKSTLPYGPDEDKIKQLLLECLEHHYGDLSSCVIVPDRATQAIKEITTIIEKINGTTRKS